MLSIALSGLPSTRLLTRVPTRNVQRAPGRVSLIVKCDSLHLTQPPRGFFSERIIDFAYHAIEVDRFERLLEAPAKLYIRSQCALLIKRPDLFSIFSEEKFGSVTAEVVRQVEDIALQHALR